MSAEAHSPQAGTKRAFQADDNSTSTEKATPTSPPQSTAAATSAFRNVSACNRCRMRKNRCDQNLPACALCCKAGVRCVGFDPITKREIPRSYVYFLETRLGYFEQLLKSHDVPYDPAETFDADARALGSEQANTRDAHQDRKKIPAQDDRSMAEQDPSEGQDDQKLENLVSNIGMVSVRGTSDNRSLGSTSGISFARVVLSAVKNSIPAGNGSKTAKFTTGAATSGGSMRDSYFGLHTKPNIQEAPFPERELGEKLVNLYFEHANPQIPILHRDEFMSMFEQAFATDTEMRTPRELYFLNMVFAIGAGIIWGSSDPEPSAGEYVSKRARMSGQQAQPEEYHASAAIHLSSFLGSNRADAAENGASDLEELQAVLLLAGFALLRPVSPGLWYIVGVAMRQAIDLGLHYEDGSGLAEIDVASRANTIKDAQKLQQQGRRQWTRDLRRRLWWCTYSFDRLVSTCVGRPLGVMDQVITTDFPSLLDDRHITKDGFTTGISASEPSYKRVAYHYFRLRLLQSEIVQVLQCQQAQLARSNGRNRHNDFMHTRLPSPFLVKHRSFKAWRKDVDQRLFEWKESAPFKAETGVSFSVQFLELNYWQAVTMLYRQSLSVPPPFAGELSPTDEIASPSSIFTEDKEDEDLVFLKCAEAGQKTLKIYRQLHRLRLVNYTYLATHHLFMAGISFLYAVWHSPAVRSRISLDDFDFTVLAATSVLGDLMVKCPPAEACRDAFERMSKATVQMCMSTPGFGFGSREDQHSMINNAPLTVPPPQAPQQRVRTEFRQPARRPPPRFDMDLKDLFPDGFNTNQSLRPVTTLPRSDTQRSNRQPRTTLSRRTSHPRTVTKQAQSSREVQMIDTNHTTIYANPPSYDPTYHPYKQPDIQQFEFVHNTIDEPMSNSYNPDFLSNLPGMNLLHRLSTSAGNETPQMMQSHMLSHAGSQQTPDPTFGEGWLDVVPTPSGDGDAESEWGLGSGFGIGVGMGLDFGPQHDWSEGEGGLNMFDGFFFGGEDGNGNG